MQTIYVLKDSQDRIRYVGVTGKTAARRLHEHLYDAQRGRDLRVYRWIRALLRQGITPQMQVIEIVSDSDRAPRECFWISYYRLQGCDLTNCTDGGDGVVNSTPEVRAKQSAAFKGKTLSEEHRAKLRASHLGIKPSEKGLAALRSQHGTPHTEATRAKMRKPKSASHRQNIARASIGTRAGENSPRARLKAVQVVELRQWYKDGGTTISQMAQHYGVSPSCVSAALYGRNWPDLEEPPVRGRPRAPRVKEQQKQDSPSRKPRVDKPRCE